MIPRSKIGSVAYALTDGDWTIDGDNIYHEIGNVGIGTTSTNAKLDINAPEGILPLKLKQNASMFPYAPSLITFATQEGDIGNIGGHLINDSNTFLVGGLDNTSFGIYANNSFASPNLFIDNTGNVGIGTTAPIAELHIKNDTDYVALQIESSNNSARLRLFGTVTENGDQVGVINFFNDSYHIAGINSFRDDGVETGNICFQTTPAGSWLPVSRMTIASSGNVGIGTSSPERKLHINDVLRLEPRSSPPSSPSAGDIYFDSDDNKLKCYDGTTWQSCWKSQNRGVQNESYK